MKNDQLSIFKDAPITKALIYLSIPSIMVSLISTLHNIIDTIYLGFLHNAEMIAATTVALPIIVIIQALTDGIGAGSGSYIGRLLGANKTSAIADTIKTTMTLSLFLSVLTFIGSFTVLKPLITVFTDSPSIQFYTYQYLQIIVMGSVFTIFKAIINYLLRNAGDVNFPMYTIIIEVILNSILNPVLMFEWGFNLGIRGAAISTIFAQGVSCIILLHRLVHHTSFIRWKLWDFGIDMMSVKKIFEIGFAVCLRNGLPSLSYGLFASSAGLFGTNFVAAAGIARKAEQIALFIPYGIAHGYQPFASYNYGANNKKRLKDSIKLALFVTTIYGFVVGLLFIVFPHFILSLINRDVELIQISSLVLKGYAIGFPVIGIYQILAGCFQAMGKGKLSLIASISKQTIFYCPVIYFLPRLFGDVGFALSQPICDWLSAIFVAILSIQLFKELKDV